MRLRRLTLDFPLTAFDCGDEDLNEFLLKDSKSFLERRIANTYILDDDGRVVAFFCLLNDKISRMEITDSRWRQIKRSFPDGKHFRSYPSVKLGRLAVSIKYRNRSIGSKILKLIKDGLINNESFSAFRFLTVDAYLGAVGFYEKNGFHLLNQKDENSSTRLMYFDLLEV